MAKQSYERMKGKKSTSSGSSTDDQKIIHFIWAGGTKLMPREVSVSNVKAWLEKNPDFKVWLWVDIKTAPGHTEKHKAAYLLEGYRERFPKCLVVYDENDIPENNTKPIIVLKDITREKVADPYIRHSIDRFDPNFGISSDLLRYKILHKYGGAYFDSDVKPGDVQLKTLKFYQGEGKEHFFHWLYVDHLTQTQKPSKKELDEFAVKGSVGNDAFVCSKNNPLVLKFYEDAKKEFDAIKSKEEKMIDACYGSFNFIGTTMSATGPLLIQEIMGLQKYEKIYEQKKLEGYKTKVQGEVVEIRPLRNSAGQVCLPEAFNTRYWINASLYRIRDSKDAEAQLDSVIKFELETFGILRLEDHFNLLCQVSRRVKKSASAILKSILTKYAKELKDVKVVQYLFTPEVGLLMKRFNLLGKVKHGRNVEFHVLGTILLYSVNRGLKSDVSKRQPLAHRFGRAYIDRLFTVFEQGVTYIKGRLPSVGDVGQIEEYESALDRFDRTLGLLEKLGLEERVNNLKKRLDMDSLRKVLGAKAKELENNPKLSDSYKDDEDEAKDFKP